MQRPAVSVVVPFAGDREDAERLFRLLEPLELGPDDELIVVDNSADGAAAAAARPGRLQVVPALSERSSYHARNVGFRASSREWLLFTDADCRPAPDLLDRYFDPVPEADVGALAGAVVGPPAQGAFLARYARSRNFLDQENGMHTAADAAATANLAVRRSVLLELDGFEEGIRSGGDVDLCRRLVRSGRTIERRPKAVVEHLHRENLAELLGSIARYSAGARWLDERYPGTAPAWPLVHGLVLCARDAAVSAAQREFEEAAFRGVDALGMFAHVIGYRASNLVEPLSN